MKIKIKSKIPKPIELQQAVGLDKGGRVQKYIDNFVLYQGEPYVPGKHIQDAGIISTKIGSGQVVYDSPDANYLYDGKLMVDPFTLKGAFYSPSQGYWSRPDTQKILDPSGRDLVFHGGRNRGNEWFDRMIEDKMDELLEGVAHIVGGK